MRSFKKKLANAPYAAMNLTLPAPEGRPIFVTGNGRSGTSWIGKTLGTAPGLLYYREPCHPERNGLTGADADAIWTRYLRAGDGNDGHLSFTLSQAFAGKFWRGGGHPFSAFSARRRTRPRVLVKEVAAFLSLPWVVARWDPVVVIVLRHPGAYVASVDNLDQARAELSRLALLRADTRLMDDHMTPALRTHLERIDDPVDAMVAAWAVRTRAMLRAKADHPGWITAVYEDVAADPVGEFERLYNALNLTWTDAVATRIAEKSTTRADGAFSTARVSAERIAAWQNQLSADQIARIRAVLDPFEIPLYDRAEDWPKDGS